MGIIGPTVNHEKWWVQSLQYSQAQDRPSIIAYWFPTYFLDFRRKSSSFLHCLCKNFFFLVVRTFKIYSLCKFQAYNTVLLTIVISELNVCSDISLFPPLPSLYRLLSYYPNIEKALGASVEKRKKHRLSLDGQGQQAAASLACVCAPNTIS